MGCGSWRLLCVGLGCFCFQAPVHQPFSFNSLSLSVPEEACSRNVRASGTLNGYEGICKINHHTRNILDGIPEVNKLISPTTCMICR